jgi:gluconokinase
MSTKFPVSPYENLHGLVYFRRMIDKIRLHADGQLGEDYIPNLGQAFDHRCCLLLEVNYEELAAIVRSGLSDEDIWNWVVRQGKAPTEEQIEVWNGFMTKRGWRDEVTSTLQRRLKEGGFEKRTDIQTMFDYIDLDEGRALRSTPLP